MEAKPEAKELARNLLADLRTVINPNAQALRKVRRQYSKIIQEKEPEYILDLAREIIAASGPRWVAYELIFHNEAAIRSITKKELDEFGAAITNWGDSDIFAAYLAGPAWRLNQIPDSLVKKWAASPNHWMRRTALVCTIALNRPSLKGTGDIPRTLSICELLINDRHHNIILALSWALRELIRHSPTAVKTFIDTHTPNLHPRVLREVTNKLTHNRKTPAKKTRG
jgi:3-methyladenine DNA glycosylase AlkD